MSTAFWIFMAMGVGCLVAAVLIVIARRLERPIAKADRKFGGGP